jgi:putative transposase
VEAKRTRHAVYNITYHLVWCPKYRRKVLGGPVAERLDELTRFKVAELGGEIVALEVQPGHVHLLVRFPPTLAVHQIMHRLKGYTSYTLRKEFSWLKSRLPALWTRSYPSTSLRTGYVGTAGEVSAQTIRHYTEAQKDCRVRKGR